MPIQRGREEEEKEGERERTGAVYQYVINIVLIERSLLKKVELKEEIKQIESIYVYIYIYICIEDDLRREKESYLI